MNESNDKDNDAVTAPVGPLDSLVAEIVETVLFAHFSSPKLPREVTREEMVEHFSTTPLPVTVAAQAANCHFSLPLSELATSIAMDMTERVKSVVFRFKDGDVNFDFRENEGARLLAKYLAPLAAEYFLLNMEAKLATAVDSLCAESVRMAVELGSLQGAKDIAEKGDRIPLEIDFGPILKKLKKDELDRDQERIMRLAGQFEGLTLATRKGRPRTWTKEGLTQALRKTTFQFRKERYRAPTLGEVAASLSKRYPDRMLLSGKSLGQMLKRYGIDWKEIKNPHN